jgi:hypothetical protein
MLWFVHKMAPVERLPPHQFMPNASLGTWPESTLAQSRCKRKVRRINEFLECAAGGLGSSCRMGAEQCIQKSWSSAPRGRLRVIELLTPHLADQEGEIGALLPIQKPGLRASMSHRLGRGGRKGHRSSASRGRVYRCRQAADLECSRRACRPEDGLLDYGLPGWVSTLIVCIPDGFCIP